MELLLQCRELKKNFGADEILNDVSFILEEREKAALVGVNGAGKTSVFRMLTREWAPDGGEVIMAQGTRVGYLPQLNGDKEKEPFSEQTDWRDSDDTANSITLYDELDSVFAPLKKMEAEIRAMEVEMGGLSGKTLDETMETYSRLTAKYEEQNGYGADSRVRGVLRGLGFTDEEWRLQLKFLSGGQRTRASLGKLLLTEPELLLLDEPTNHLDIESVAWLEDYLRGFNGALIVISHDRYFMDRVTTKTIEIENKKSKVYSGSYSVFAAQKAVNREIRQKHYIQQQKTVKHHEEVIKTLRSYKTEMAIIRAKSREKLLDKIERVDKPDDLPDKMRLMLTPKLQSGYDVLNAGEVSMAFDGKKLFENVSFELKKGDKVALIGPNGIGKTTLFKILMGDLTPVTGRIREGVNVRKGYYDQAQQRLSEDKNLFQELADTYPLLSQTEIRNVLAAFVFTGDDVFKPIAALSGGERGRVALAKIMLGGANFLVLDEPTNHLDLFSKEILEEAIKDFPGTVLYISHDRYFINHTATRVLEMSPAGLTEYLGNYDYYLEKKRAKQSEDADASKSDVKNPAEPNGYKAKKESESQIRRGRSRQLKLEEKIKETEEQIEVCDKLLNDDSIARDAEAAAKIFGDKTALEEELLTLYENWEEGEGI